MGNKKNVLIIGRHAPMLTHVMDLLQANGYTATGALTNEEALSLFQSGSFAAVIIGGGVDTPSRHLFHESFVKTNPDVKIINAHPQTVLRDLAAALGDP